MNRIFDLRRWLIACLSFSLPGLLGQSPGTKSVQDPGKRTSFFRSTSGIERTTNPLPANLDDKLNRRWRIPLDSGHSSPVVIGDRIVLTTFRESTRELATVAIHWVTGRELWRRSIAPEKIEEFHRTSGNPATPTPAFDGERIFTFFGSHGLQCLDLDGKILWEQKMGPFQDEYGAGSSPVLWKDMVILNQDHDADNHLIAFDARTGKVRWRTARPDAVRSYSTPVLWHRGDETDLLVAGALEISAYDPDTGARRWWSYGLARIVIPVPVPVGDTLYVASWAPGGDAGKRISLPSISEALEKWDGNGDKKLTRAEVQDKEVLDRFFRMDIDQDGMIDAREWERHAAVFSKAKNSALALRPGKSPRGELPPEAVVWQHSKGVPYVASPLVESGRFWMVKDGGIVTQLDAAAGRVTFEERLPGGGSYFASPVMADGKIYFAGENGSLNIVTNSASWSVLSTKSFGEHIYATPAIAGDSMILRTDKALYRYALPITTR